MMSTISGNPHIYLIPPRYVCKVDNFLFFKIAAAKRRVGLKDQLGNLSDRTQG